MKKQVISAALSTAIVFGTVSTGSVITAASSPSGFSDIQGSFAKEAIQQLLDKGIIQGDGSGKFDPKGQLTRAQFVKMIVLSMGLKVDESVTQSTQFNDVPSWAAAFVDAAFKAQLIKGTGVHTFSPNLALTREQAAVIMVNALISAGSISKDEKAELTFKDSDTISSWAKDAVALAFKLGLIKGNTDGTFNPKGQATREQAAQMSSNFIDTSDKLEKTNPEPEPTTSPQPTSSPGTGTPGGGYNDPYTYVSSWEQLKDAVIVSNKMIRLSTDITVNGVIDLTATGVTLDGNGKTITFTGANNMLVRGNNAKISNVTFKNSSDYNLEIYNVTGVTLNNVTSNLSGKGGILINASTVTASNIHTSGNDWGGIEVAKGDGVAAESDLTISGTNSHTESVPIWTIGASTVSFDNNSQYIEIQDKRSNKSNYKNYLLKSTVEVVDDLAELKTAVAKSNVRIVLNADIPNIKETIAITGHDVILDGFGHKIGIVDPAVVSNKYLFVVQETNNVVINDVIFTNEKEFGIQVYKSTNVTLKGVTAEYSGKGGVLVNGSTVTVKGITTSGNAWGGIEVAKGDGVAAESELTISGTNSHTESVPIWTIGASTVSFDNNSQYIEIQDKRSNKSNYKNYLLKSTVEVVDDLAELKTAVAKNDVRIVLNADFLGVNESIDVTGTNVTIDGFGHEVAISGIGNRFIVSGDNVTINDVIFTNINEYGIQVYDATGVKLNRITAQDSGKGGILINGSQVTVNAIKTLRNENGGIEVSNGAGVGYSELNVTGTNVHDDKTEIAIWTINEVDGGVVADNNIVVGSITQYKTAEEALDKPGYTYYKVKPPTP
ncbi:S-layer homology domain-containing protein [Cohnella soli]|uniref:S-layer homology domain-containing protein n=1 Tax=Cohnella soli TaxID=425005 RepID=A0ABW0HUR9_9BACL